MIVDWEEERKWPFIEYLCFFKGNGLVSKVACLWVELLDFPLVQPNLTLQHIVQTSQGKLKWAL